MIGAFGTPPFFVVTFPFFTFVLRFTPSGPSVLIFISLPFFTPLALVPSAVLFMSVLLVASVVLPVVPVLLFVVPVPLFIVPVPFVVVALASVLPELFVAFVLFIVPLFMLPLFMLPLNESRIIVPFELFMLLSAHLLLPVRMESERMLLPLLYVLLPERGRDVSEPQLLPVVVFIELFVELLLSILFTVPDVVPVPWLDVEPAAGSVVGVTVLLELFMSLAELLVPVLVLVLELVWLLLLCFVVRLFAGVVLCAEVVVVLVVFVWVFVVCALDAVIIPANANTVKIAFFIKKYFVLK